MHYCHFLNSFHHFVINLCLFLVHINAAALNFYFSQSFTFISAIFQSQNGSFTNLNLWKNLFTCLHCL